jgi:dTDP-4-dehydrorhamnose 3,5-epimerase-like enzyme
MKYKIIDFPTIKDARGNLAVVEKNTLPFDFKRVYYLYDVPSNSYRGGHAHICQREVLVAISGSFEVVLKHDNQETTVFLNAPDRGLLIDKMVWRELKNFSSGSICLVMASDEFDEADYIRDWETFAKTEH